MEITNPHDKFFKETFSVQGNVIDFLQGTFPKEILEKLDLSALTLDSNTYIDSGFFEVGRKYFEEEEGLRFLESVVRYLYNTTEIEAGKVINTVKQISEKGGGLVMTTAMKLIEKGKAEGKLEGLKEAIALGLELKYGTEGLNLCEKIAPIVSLEKLELIKKTVKTSKKLQEIERLL